MAKIPAEEKNYCIELNRNVCKTRQITTAYGKKASFRSCDLNSLLMRILFFGPKVNILIFLLILSSCDILKF